MYHVYSLPPELLDTLSPRNLANHDLQRDTTAEPVVSIPSGGQRTCNICLGATFVDLEEQRTHFRSDWHRYNVKTRLNGGNPVAETTFTQLVDGMSSSAGISFSVAHRFQVWRIPFPDLPLLQVETILRIQIQ